MALTIKQLHGDASFLLTLEPIELDFVSRSSSSEPFRILLDPCLPLPERGPSSGLDDTQRKDACVTLQDLPEPDIVVISSSRSEHCHEATLRQFAPSSPRPLIFAEPSAARTIQSWRHFADGKVSALRKWQDPRHTGRDNTVRVPIPAKVIAGDEGLVTISFIVYKRDKRRTGSAIGITYKPASSGRSIATRPVSTILDGPALMPWSSHPQRSLAPPSPLDTPTLPPLPSFTPLTPPATPKSRVIRTARSLASLSPHAKDRSVSVIFSPHGMPYSGIEPFATSHLLTEAALPLTSLLHPFDQVSRPWWLGGDLPSSLEDGQEIVEKLGAKAWIRTCHDRSAHGLARRFTRHKKHSQEEIRQLVRDAVVDGKTDSVRARPTEVLALSDREEVMLTSEGVWAAELPCLERGNRPSIRLVPDDAPDSTSRMATCGQGNLRPTAAVA